MQQAVHRIKYKRDLSLGIELARLITRFVEDMNWPIEIVIPVPLGMKRKSERGYNQVSLITFPLALRLGMRYVPGGLIRIRETESQVGLNAYDRHENVKDAFLANSHRVAGKNILLIDDVATTGATLSSCACALKAGGASNVYAITLTRALPIHGLSAS
jgi:ComF family protein